MITAEYMRTGTDGSTTVPAEGTGQGDHRQHRTQTYQKQLYPVTTSADVAWRSSATLPPDKGSVIFRHETSSCPPGSLTHDVNNRKTRTRQQCLHRQNPSPSTLRVCHGWTFIKPKAPAIKGSASMVSDCSVLGTVNAMDSEASSRSRPKALSREGVKALYNSSPRSCRVCLNSTLLNS